MAKAKAAHCPPDPKPVETTRERDNDTGTTRRRVRTPVIGVSLTEQHHKPHVDINNIMARYIKTGTLDHVRTYEGQYSELPEADFHDAATKVAEARSMFEELPSQMRKHFDNDPARFLAFCEHHENPASELTEIAEGYRKRSLGLDVQPDSPIDPRSRQEPSKGGGETPGEGDEAGTAESPESGG